ncbi:MAG: hypothetical protein AB1607_16420 [Chloroflexota bacterium]
MALLNFLSIKLRFIQLGIQPIQCDQLLVRAAFDDLSTIYYQRKDLTGLSRTVANHSDCADTSSDRSVTRGDLSGLLILFLD